MSAPSPVVILWKDALSAATMGGALSAAFGSRRGLTILANMYGTSFIGMGAGAMMVPKDLFALFKWSYPTEPSAQEVVDRVMMGYGARDIFMGVAMYAVTLFGNSRTLGAILICESAIVVVDSFTCRTSESVQWTYWGLAPTLAIMGALLMR